MPDSEDAYVLVVDDDPSLRTAAERLLARAGFRVRGAASVREAIAALRDRSTGIRAAVIDLALGADDGLTLVRHVRARRPNVGIVVFSATLDAATRAQLIALGVRAMVDKPASPETLLAAVRGAVLPADSDGQAVGRP